MDEQIIARIVRQNFGRFRFCYEKTLKTKPAARGRIETTFTIDSFGDVVDVTSASSNFTDKEMLACMERSFLGLSFPNPPGGVAVVRFPILFAPPGSPAPEPTNRAPALPPEPKPQIKTIGGVTFDKLDGAALRSELGGASRQVELVPVPSPPAPPIAFAREFDGTVSVATRVSGVVKSPCAVSEAGFSVVAHALDETTCRNVLRDLLDKPDR